MSEEQGSTTEQFVDDLRKEAPKYRAIAEALEMPYSDAAVIMWLISMHTRLMRIEKALEPGPGWRELQERVMRKMLEEMDEGEDWK